MSRVDWPALMAVGLVELRLSPEIFWDLSPAELMFLINRGRTGSGAMSRNGLDALMAAYPDRSERDPEHE